MKIKLLYIIMAASFILTACGQNQTNKAQAKKVVDSADMPIITFDHETFNFENIKQGELVKHEYIFTNTGKTPLNITDAIPSCGCTTPEYSKLPIKPGEKGKINVVFNSENFDGKVMKVIIIQSNATVNPVSLKLEGTITAKK